MGVYKLSPGRLTPFETVAILIACNCGDLEHAVKFSYEPYNEWPELSFEFHLVHRGVFSRLRAAIRYVFGYRCRYGEWDSLDMDPGSARDLAQFLLEYSKIATNQRERYHPEIAADIENTVE